MQRAHGHTAYYLFLSAAAMLLHALPPHTVLPTWFPGIPSPGYCVQALIHPGILINILSVPLWAMASLHLSAKLSGYPRLV